MSASDPNFIVSSLPSYVKENQDFLIKEVVFGGDYPYQDTVKKMFRQAGVKCRRFG